MMLLHLSLGDREFSTQGAAEDGRGGEKDDGR